MKLFLATWLLEPQQGRSLTKKKAKNRLISYWHTLAKADQLKKYVIKGINK